MKTITNNTVLSNFAYVDRLDLLKNLFGELYLTPEVKAEVENGVICGHIFQERTKKAIYNHEWLLVIGLETQELYLFNELLKRLGAGESSCLALAKMRKWGFLSDDKDARRIAEKLDIVLGGTIGVLRSAYTKD